MIREEEKTGGNRGEEKRRKRRNLKEDKVRRWDEKNSFLINIVNKTVTW
jgi:hypothetical protein